MPTGYTNEVMKGEIEFEDFVLKCARAFGACNHQRGNDYKEKPKLDEVSDYYPNRVKQLKKELVEIEGISLEDWKNKVDKQIKKQEKSYLDGMAEQKQSRKNYESMLEKAKNWEPPSSRHIELKHFMQKQLQESIDFDCVGDYYNDALERIKKPKTDEDYKNLLNKEKKQVEESLNRAKKSLEEEQEGVNSRNEWITQLYKSLNEEIS